MNRGQLQLVFTYTAPWYLEYLRPRKEIEIRHWDINIKYIFINEYIIFYSQHSLYETCSHWHFTSENIISSLFRSSSAMTELDRHKSGASTLKQQLCCSNRFIARTSWPGTINVQCVINFGLSILGAVFTMCKRSFKALHKLSDFYEQCWHTNMKKYSCMLLTISTKFNHEVPNAAIIDSFCCPRSI